MAISAALTARLADIVTSDATLASAASTYATALAVVPTDLPRFSIMSDDSIVTDEPLTGAENVTVEIQADGGLLMTGGVSMPLDAVDDFITWLTTWYL